MNMVSVVRALLCGALLAGCFGVVLAEEVDVKALRARLAEQEAQMEQLEARMNSRPDYANASVKDCAEGVVSLNKNATVTIGGFLNQKYEHYNGKVDSIYANAEDPTQAGGNGSYERRAKAEQSDWRFTHSRLTIKVDVNAHFDALVHIDLQSSADNRSDNCHRYYVRWKKIADSGFGIKVGRDDLVFGPGNLCAGEQAVAAKSGEGAMMFMRTGTYRNNLVNGSRLGQGNSYLLPAHNHWDNTRIDQIVPYWEGLDGKLKFEAAFFQNLSNNGASGGRINNDRAGQPQTYLDGGAYKNRNYGLGSFSARINYAPIEGLKFTASVLNFYDNNKGGTGYFSSDGTVNVSTAAWKNTRAKNNTAVDFAVSYTPSFLPRLNVWAEYNHGWNVFGARDVDADVLSYGANVKITDRIRFFAAGDFIRTTDKLHQVGNAYANNDKASYWAAYTGLRYAFPYGAVVEIGWKHENLTWKQNTAYDAGGTLQRTAGRRTTLKAKADMIYGHVGFSF